MIDRKHYKWNRFKMTWLVPNYARAKGPAWWLWNAGFWLKYHLDKENCWSYRHRLSDWWHEKAVRWVFPHLYFARKFNEFCIEQNGTKLLDHGAHYFYIRSRDEHQWYFYGEVDWLGRFTVKSWQWIGDDGKPVNAFLTGICNALSEEEDKKHPVKQEKLLMKRWILTPKQLRKAENEAMEHPEFCWDHRSIAEDRLFEALHLAATGRRGFLEKIHKSVMADLGFSGEWYELDEEDYNRFSDKIVFMTVEDAKRRLLA